MKKEILALLIVFLLFLSFGFFSFGYISFLNSNQEVPFLEYIFQDWWKHLLLSAISNSVVVYFIVKRKPKQQ